MTAERTIERLETLLEQIRRNAARPRRPVVIITAAPRPAPNEAGGHQAPVGSVARPAVPAKPWVSGTQAAAVSALRSEVAVEPQAKEAEPAIAATAPAETRTEGELAESRVVVAEAEPVLPPRPVLAGLTEEEEEAAWEMEPEQEAPTRALEAAAPAPAAEDEQLELSGDLELLDEDIVDLTDLPAEEAARLSERAQALEDSTAFELEAEPPSSSRRPKLLATSMDEALAAAAAEEVREIPLQTPPPESGRQVAPATSGAQLQQPPPPADLAESLAGVGALAGPAELGLVSMGRESVETQAEQEEQRRSVPRLVPLREQLEAELGFTPLPPPPGREIASEPVLDQAPPPVPERPSTRPPSHISEHPGASTPAGADALASPAAASTGSEPAPPLSLEVMRPAVPDTVPARVVGSAPSLRSSTFAQLLDASLDL